MSIDKSVSNRRKLRWAIEEAYIKVAKETAVTHEDVIAALAEATYRATQDQLRAERDEEE